MSDPIFVLGCHRSGTSVVAGLLHKACGVVMGELMPGTIDNPLGYFEAVGVVEAHRSLLYQMERDWTCPPSAFRPERLDLTELREQVDLHRALETTWAVKDPRLMFLLPAWAELGTSRARLVGVARSPTDTAESIATRDRIRSDRAEAIVDAYLWRLAEVASATSLPVIRFSDDADDVLAQARALASSLELDWDERSAAAFFDAELIRQRTSHQETTPAYDALLSRASSGARVPSTELGALDLCSAPEWPLETHLGVRYSMQRNELWELAEFRTAQNPEVVEFVLEGARLRPIRRPGVGKLHHLELTTPEAAGATLIQHGVRPHGVVANGLLSGRSSEEVELFFRSLHASTHIFSELVIDVPAPSDNPPLATEPAPYEHPTAEQVEEIATACGWDALTARRLSPGRRGLIFRKRAPVEPEFMQAATELNANVDRLFAIEAQLSSVQEQLAALHAQLRRSPASRRRTPDATGEELERLRSRRSVRLALALSQPFAGAFRRFRAWKSAR